MLSCMSVCPCVCMYVYVCMYSERMSILASQIHFYDYNLTIGMEYILGGGGGRERKGFGLFM